MLTLSEKYPGHSVGQGDPIAIMQIWDKWFVVLPCPIAAKKVYVNRHWIAQQCDIGALIAKKVGGCWWIAIQPLTITPLDFVTGNRICDRLLEKSSVK